MVKQAPIEGIDKTVGELLKDAKIGQGKDDEEGL